jgi:hypothetical protein
MAILVQCPVCAEALEAPDDAAGKGCPCPICRAVVAVPVAAPSPSSRIHACPTCGKSLTIPPELANEPVTCPYCQREFRTRTGRRRRRFECPHCGTHEPPERTRQISTAGWIIFAVFLAFFLPLFWVGLLITERVDYCYDCGKRVR